FPIAATPCPTATAKPDGPAGFLPGQTGRTAAASCASARHPLLPGTQLQRVSWRLARPAGAALDGTGSRFGTQLGGCRAIRTTDGIRAESSATRGRSLQASAY